MLTKSIKPLLLLCCAAIVVSCGQATPQNQNENISVVPNMATENINAELTSSGATVAPDLEEQINSRTVEVEQPSTPLSK